MISVVFYIVHVPEIFLDDDFRVVIFVMQLFSPLGLAGLVETSG